MVTPIRSILDEIYPLPDESARQLLGQLQRVSYPKGHRILRAGKTESAVYFLEQGVAAASVSIKGRQVTFWIGTEGATIVSLKSYTDHRPGYETVTLMEDSVLYALQREELERLFAEDIHMANWGRKFAESEFLRTEQRLISLLFMTATERYVALLRENPGLLQRMSLETLASYLGITPVSLSRIRGSLK